MTEEFEKNVNDDLLDERTIQDAIEEHGSFPAGNTNLYHV